MLDGTQKELGSIISNTGSMEAGGPGFDGVHMDTFDFLEVGEKLNGRAGKIGSSVMMQCVSFLILSGSNLLYMHTQHPISGNLEGPALKA